MLTVEDIERCVFEITDQEKIPFTQKGVDYLYQKVKEKLQIGDGVFEFQKMHEISYERRFTRFIPEIYLLED